MAPSLVRAVELWQETCEGTLRAVRWKLHDNANGSQKLGSSAVPLAGNYAATEVTSRRNPMAPKAASI